ncbi:MAG: hypothetical protein Q9164_001496, partial [Protoblastenia rupestris]
MDLPGSTGVSSDDESYASSIITRSKLDEEMDRLMWDGLKETVRSDIASDRFLTADQVEAAFGKIEEYRHTFEAQQTCLYAHYDRLIGMPVAPADGRTKLHWVIKARYRENGWPLRDGERPHAVWTRKQMDLGMNLLHHYKVLNERQINDWRRLPGGSLRVGSPSLENSPQVPGYIVSSEVGHFYPDAAP